ncbi:MAG: hypothetical protein FJ358_08435, partial [Thaumarchaeota archaeon]|nr:hypothetical protein [Nitrososphaerota archaeon]
MSDKLRVLHLISVLGFAGAGHNITPYLRFANSDYFDVVMGSISSADPRRERALAANGIRVVNFHGDLDILTQFMKNEGIDILHFYRGGKEHSEIFGASLRANVPIRTELN